MSFMKHNFTDDHFKVETFMEYVREKSSKGELSKTVVVLHNLSVRHFLAGYSGGLSASCLVPGLDIGIKVLFVQIT